MPDGMWTEAQFQEFIVAALSATISVSEATDAIPLPTRLKIQDVQAYILSDKLPGILAVFNAAQSKGTK